jgi:hypothetical protein
LDAQFPGLPHLFNAVDAALAILMTSAIQPSRALNRLAKVRERS